MSEWRSHYVRPACWWRNDRPFGPIHIEEQCEHCGSRGLTREASPTEVWNLMQVVTMLSDSLNELREKVR